MMPLKGHTDESSSQDPEHMGHSDPKAVEKITNLCVENKPAHTVMWDAEVKGHTQHLFRIHPVCHPTLPELEAPKLHFPDSLAARGDHMTGLLACRIRTEVMWATSWLCPSALFALVGMQPR